MDAINDFILQAAASPWLLLVMFVVAVLDGLFPPVPSETVLVAAAAAAAATGDYSGIALLCLAGSAGAVIGDNLAYAAGRRVGVTRFAWMRGVRVSAAFDRAHSALRRRGAPLILGARYIPVGRVAVNLSAGALRYPWRRFLPLSLVAAVTWSIYTALIGSLAGHVVKGQPLLGVAIGIGVALAVGVAIDLLAGGRRRHAPVEPARSTRSSQSPISVATISGRSCGSAWPASSITATVEAG
ncbi:DedA family protein [Microbacterium sp. 179-B 1A2 NHS]|uniref:DedA family protein n=1 Tax=Microbacterium sp. 179-B 1A2 NHS TaxID=3142383 RepID=UPI0039A1E22E